MTVWPKDQERSDEEVAPLALIDGSGVMAKATEANPPGAGASGSVAGASSGSAAMPGTSDATEGPKDFTYNLYQNMTPIEVSKMMLEAAIIMKKLRLRDEEKLAHRVHIGSGLRFKIEGVDEVWEGKFDGADEVAERMDGLNIRPIG